MNSTEPGAWRALWSYTFGFATFRVESRRGVRSALAALSDEEYPSLAGAVDELADALASGDEFARGLDRLMDSLERELAAAAPAR